MDVLDLKTINAELQIGELQIMCDGALKIDWQKLLDLQTLEDGRSLKETDDEKIIRLAESLLRFGIVNNLQVWFDENGDCYCFDAHHRKKALEIINEIGVKIPPLPATRCLASSKTEARRLLFVKESKSSWVNYKIVPDYLRETGFSFKIASRVIDLPELKWNEVCEASENAEENQEKEDAIPEPPPEIYIKTGDLIELGKHRLLCGDAANAEDMARLMDGEKADMVFTDPPYGIGEAAGKNKSRSNKAKAVDYGNKDWDDHIAPESAFDLMREYSVEQMIFGGNFFVEYLRNSPCWLVWNKDNGENDFADCELIWTSLNSAVRLYKYRWNGMLQEDMKNKEKRFHPTQKPIGLFINIFHDYQFLTCLDPFLGSGSTLIACEKTGRRCFGMEIDPYYCQIVVQRYVDFTENCRITINGKDVDWLVYAGGA